MQIILGLFCIVFGGTGTFMKKDEIIDLILAKKRSRYESQVYKLDPIIKVLRVLSALVALMGLYICLSYIYYMFINPAAPM